MMVINRLASSFGKQPTIEGKWTFATIRMVTMYLHITHMTYAHCICTNMGQLAHFFMTYLAIDKSVVMLQYGFTPYLLYNSSQLSNLLGLSLPTSTTGRRSMLQLQASSASSSANPYTKSRVPQRINFNNLTVNSKVYTYMTAVKNQLQCGETAELTAVNNA